MRDPTNGALGNVQFFLDDVMSGLDSLNIDVSNLELDHICYRVESEHEYQHMKATISEYGKLLVESQVGGRLISTFQLTRPIVYDDPHTSEGDRVIRVIELPSPKEGSPYKSGLEHAEFVIGKYGFKMFQAMNPAPYNRKAISKPINADISVALPPVIVDGEKRVYTAKFHLQPLADVIKQELGR